ncbi:neutral/alkaline non-lysosomal ceramidase N-terminal domain-containing protein [Maioricimonas sp. JC845]|uniref:neutral/alkaline non-lysosomal ceramidase N-terminal domain-containing protein n=1 Tax=Maioricimonas sp. JC845 TaxID=3232138 RepID=UPI00345B05F4
MVSAFSLAVSTGYAADDAQQVLRAGAAASNITPPLGEAVVGGFAPFPATNVHDELHARCLVLDDGTTRIGFVICDSLGISRDVFDQAREYIDAETDFPAENILMSATHTHSATRSSSENYSGFLARRIADAVRRAIANMEPARIGWGGVDEPSEVFNRRWYVTDPDLRKNPFGGADQVRMNPPRGSATLVRPAGPIDPEISFISVQSADGRPLALLANYSLHYVGGVNKGEISADYFGIFSKRIGELLEADDESFPPFVGMLSNGTSGDINNINFRNPSKRMEKYAKMRQVAELVARRVHEACGQVEYHDWVPLGSASRDLTLRVRKPDEAMLKYFEEVMAKPEDAPKHHRYERNYAQRVRRLYEGPDEISIPLQAVRIGDLGIAAIPFEVFCEIGLEIKEKSPFGDAFTIELANDSRGYLPTPRQHELGGYETWMGTNRVQHDASDRITETILELMGELSSKRPSAVTSRDE